MSAAWAFIRKDIEDALRSHSLVFVLLGPLLLSLLFINFMQDSGGVKASAAVGGFIESGLVQAMRGGDFCVLEISEDGEKSRQAVKDGSLNGYIEIPAGFDEALKSDEYPELHIYLNEGEPVKAALLREAVRTALRSMAGQELPADIRIERVGSFEGSMTLAFLPMWIVFTCLGAMSVTSSLLVEEIDGKTLNAVLLAPVRWWDILAGKIFCGLILAFLSAALMLALCYRGGGNYAVMAALIFLGSFVFAAAGVIIGLVCKKPSLCGAVNSLVYLLMIMPVTMADYSDLMRRISGCLPAWYLCGGLNQVMFAGASWSAAGTDLLLLLVFGMLFTAAAAFLMKGTGEYA